MSKIHQLSSQFVDFLGSGEIIQDCTSFIKELIENSLDAKSDNIEITILLNNDHLTQVVIQDNGLGIHKDDLPMLCKRYFTSKLSDYSALHHLTYFGFRGEALNAISFNSFMSVITGTG